MNPEKIKEVLESDIAPHLDDQNTKHAAVLVVIYGDELKTIMTQKPMTMQPHGGEISFPGGKLAVYDKDLLDTALRETKEEIALELSREQIIGQLRPVQTRNSGFTIIPFVSVIDDVPTLHPNSEVEEILHIPIIPLLNQLRLDDDVKHKALFEAYVTTFGDKIIWGASARILKQIFDTFKQNNLL